MTTFPVRPTVIRLLGPTAFYLARMTVMLLRFYGRVMYDRNLLFVRCLAPQPLLINVGANAGQSALCLAMLRPDACIVSFEANADNVRDLAFVRRILGDRCSYHHVGLSDRHGSAILKVPVVGRSPVPGASSFLEEFDSSIEDRIGKISKIAEQEVGLKTFDSFGLRPAFVKIGVQGHELEVVRGMEGTKSSCKSLLLLEKGFRFHQIRNYLSALSYELCNFEQGPGELVPCDPPRGINYFAISRDQRALFSMDVGRLPP